jgi:hypothetical protein
MRRQKANARSALQARNLTRGTTLVSAGRVARSFFARLRGLMGSAPLAPGEGLLIIPCSSVHTHFMRFPIDVLYVNARGEVVGIDPALTPWRFGHFYRRVRFVIELPAGTAQSTATQVGDRLDVLGL